METAYSHLSDQELLRLLNAGSEGAYKEIYERYWGVLFVHALKMIKDKEAARDVVQELYINLWNRRESLAEVSSLRSYLYSAVRNRVINELLRQKNQKRTFNAFHYHINTESVSVLEHIQERQLAEIIEQECKHLPEKMRRVFELSRKQHLSHKEIARVLNISDKTVKKQVGNVIRQIKLKISYLFIFSCIFCGF